MAEQQANEWQPKASAPRDGTKFMGRNKDSGSEYVTWFEDTVEPDTAADKEWRDTLAGLFNPELGLWWATRPDGSVASFIFHEWRPLRADEAAE